MGDSNLPAINSKSSDNWQLIKPGKALAGYRYNEIPRLLLLAKEKEEQRGEHKVPKKLFPRDLFKFLSNTISFMTGVPII